MSGDDRDPPDESRQLPMEFPPAPSARDSDTSIASARAIDPLASELRKAVYDHIRKSGGCTDDEGERALKMRVQTYTPRRWELVNANLVQKQRDANGKLVKRQTGSRRAAQVWEVKPR